jgi:hypothetical protein
MSSKRRIVYQIDVTQIDEYEFIDTIRRRFGLEPERTDDPQPYPDKKIFISYRRDDSVDVTGRIYDWLQRHFGEQSLFRDYDSMPSGADFRQVLEQEVLACDVMLVIMGDRWDSDAMLKRLLDEDDYVRYEMSVALRRGIPVIPVWVQSRTTAPDPQILPLDIRNVVYRQACMIRSDKYFASQMTVLIDEMEQIFDTDPLNTL